LILLSNLKQLANPILYTSTFKNETLETRVFYNYIHDCCVWRLDVLL